MASPLLDPQAAEQSTTSNPIALTVMRSSYARAIAAGRFCETSERRNGLTLALSASGEGTAQFGSAVGW
jgi:hypothetical protein